MKLFVHLPAPSAYTYWRCVLPLKHLAADLKAEGFEIAASSQIDDQLGHADWVMLHGMIDPRFLKQILDLPCKIIWSMDDALLDIPPWNPLYGTRGYTEQETLRQCLARAERIWVTTPTLGEALGHPEKTVAVPNLIDSDLYPPFQERESSRVLWAGGNTHQADLELIDELPALLPDREFIFFGDLPEKIAAYHRRPGETIQMKPNRSNVGFVEATNIKQYPQVLKQLAASGGVALCPLSDHVFNRCKSPLKYLEMAAHGLPVIASNVEPYNRIIEHGENGYLVEEIDEWVYWTKNANEAVAHKGYQDVHQNWSWQSHAREVWLDAFKNLAD